MLPHRLGVLCRAIIPAGCFLLVALLLGWPALVGRGALGPEVMLDADPLYGGPRAARAPIVPPSDPTPIALDLPRDLAVAHGLWHGRIDQWNPRAGCGTPLWAELGGPFFPLKALFYLVPTPTTYAAFLLVRLAAAALGTYLLVRRRGGGVSAAIAAGISFELCSSLLYQTPFGVYSNTFVLPWLVLAADALTTRPGAHTAAAAGIAIGVAASAGHAGIGVVVLGAFAAAMAGNVVASWREPRAILAPLRWTAVAVALGLALAAPTLLPTAHVIGIGTSYKDEAIGQMLRRGVLDAGRLFLPQFLFLPFERSEVLGVASVGVAAIGVLAGGIDASLLAVGFLGLLVGVAPLGFHWINDIPAMRLLLPIYAYPLLALPLAVAIGRGVDVLRTFPARWIPLAAVSPVFAWGVLSLLCVPTTVLHPPTVLIKRLFLTVAIVSGTLLLAAAIRKTRGGPYAAAILTLAIAGERLAAVLPRMQRPAATVLTASTPDAIRVLQRQGTDGMGRMIGVPSWVGYPLTTTLFGLTDARNFAAFPLRRYVEYLEAVDTALPPDRPRETATAMVVQKVQATRSPLLDLAAVRWVAVPRRQTEAPAAHLDGDARMPLVVADRYALVYENRASLPRVRIAHRVISAPNQEAARSWAQRIGATGGHASDVDVINAVVLEPDHQGTPPPRHHGRPTGPERVAITDTSDPDRLLITATLTTPGVVVVADTYDPGWRAWLDDAPAPIHPANLMFRGIAVPAGTHRIELRYAPRAFTVGVMLFLLATVACGLLLFVGRRPTVTSAKRAAEASVP